jgi:Lrp/AsnC family transcriptional regulator for asnA, asnC and gidA
MDAANGVRRNETMPRRVTQQPAASPSKRRSQDVAIAAPLTLDDVDRKIIGVLQGDGRCPYGTIAEQVGLSEAAVRRRVQRLREAGIMDIVAVTDPLQLGFTREALVGIRVQGDVRLVADKIASIDEANYVVLCAGSFDILAELVTADDDSLLHLLNDSIRSIPGITEVETFIYLKLAKQTFNWGTR